MASKYGILIYVVGISPKFKRSRKFQDFLRQQAEYRQQQQQQLAAQQQQPGSMQDTVRNIIANTDFSSFDPNRPRSPGAASAGAVAVGRRVVQVRATTIPYRNMTIFKMYWEKIRSCGSTRKVCVGGRKEVTTTTMRGESTEWGGGRKVGFEMLGKM